VPLAQNTICTISRIKSVLLKEVLIEDVAMGIDKSLIQNMDTLSAEFGAFMAKQQPTDEESVRFHHVVTAIGNAANANYTALRRAFADDEQSQLSWACRNLLELAVFAKYVIKSKANLQEFAADRLIDGLQIAESLKALELHLNPSLKSSALDAVIQRFNAQKQKEKIIRSRYLRVEDLAEVVNLAEEYKIVNRLCSKMIHPTAWALLTDDLGPARFPEGREILYGTGATYFAMVCEQFMPHIRKHGLSHN
jgi:hypothetical protein